MSATKAQARPAAAARILIVATDPVVSALLGAFVELEGHQPLYTAPGAQAVLAYARLHPNLVLVAIDDPDDDTEALLARAACRGAAVLACRPAEHAPSSHGRTPPCLRQATLPLTRAGLARALAGTYVGHSTSRARRSGPRTPWRSARAGARGDGPR